MKIGVMFLGRKRPGFDQPWGKRVEQAARTALAATRHDVLAPDALVVDEASLRETLARFRAANVDVLLALQPTIADGRISARLGQLWDEPVVLWATPENPEGTKVSSCSLVGAQVFAANLRQLRRPFELVYGMPGDSAVEQELDCATRVVYAWRRLHRSKVGLIGYHAPGFIDMHADPAELSAQIGPELFHTGVQELVDRMQTLSDARVQQDVGATVAMGLPMDGVETGDLLTASRFYLALKDFVAEERLDALAVRDWPELPNLTGQWPYLAICRLVGEDLPVALEGDVDGALTSLVGCLLGCGPGYLSDWLEHDKQTITLWHGGCAPLTMCDPPGSPHGPRIGRHFNNDKPAVVNARLAPDKPVTICRLWRCDNLYRLMAEDVMTVVPKRSLEGTFGAVEVHGRDLHPWFRELCFAGMPHHVVVLPGRQTEPLRRLARLLDIEIQA